MKEIVDLLPRVHEACAACPEPLAVRHLRDAAIEFCRRTRIWRETESFTLPSEGYDCIVLQHDRQIFEIRRVTATTGTGDDTEIRDLDPKTVDWLDQERPDWRTAEGSPQYFTQISPNTVRVTPIPEDETAITLELVLLPSEDAEDLIDVLIDTYPRVLVDGALAAILGLPSDFADPDLAAKRGAMFMRALDHWGNLVPRGQQRAVRRVKPSKTF